MLTTETLGKETSKNSGIDLIVINTSSYIADFNCVRYSRVFAIKDDKLTLQSKSYKGEVNDGVEKFPTVDWQNEHFHCLEYNSFNLFYLNTMLLKQTRNINSNLIGEIFDIQLSLINLFSLLLHCNE